MTIQETIQMLERMLYPEPWEDDGLSDKAKEALQMAVEALEHPEEMLTCEGCKYNDGRKINSPCYKCMRADSDWYEQEKNYNE